MLCSRTRTKKHVLRKNKCNVRISNNRISSASKSAYEKIYKQDVEDIVGAIATIKSVSKKKKQAVRAKELSRV